MLTAVSFRGHEEYVHLPGLITSIKHSHIYLIMPNGHGVVDLSCVLVGASVGAACRWYTTQLKPFVSKPYIGILALNGVGSLILGGLYGIQTRMKVNSRVGLLLGVGFCGAMTTFSTFSVDVLKFVENNEIAKAGLYVVGSNVTGIGAAFGGFQLARKVIRK